MGTLQVATNCFFTALNWTTGKLTVVDSRLVSLCSGRNYAQMVQFECRWSLWRQDFGASEVCA